MRPSLTLFLTGAECPFTCVFCDLWRYTLEEKTAPGSLPRQIERLLHLAAAEAPIAPEVTTLKLYNASNFFDPRSVPVADDPAIRSLVAPFRRVVVESHPRFVGERCFEWSESLPRRLEVALGLETVHPEVFPRLNKGTTLELLETTVRELVRREIGVRLFVLVSPPFLPAADAVDWAVRAVAHGIELGARHVTLIPTRGGNGALERLATRGEFEPTSLGQLEEALERSQDLEGSTVVTADLWDIGSLHRSADDLAARLAHLEERNLTGGAPGP